MSDLDDLLAEFDTIKPKERKNGTVKAKKAAAPGSTTQARPTRAIERQSFSNVGDRSVGVLSAPEPATPARDAPAKSADSNVQRTGGPAPALAGYKGVRPPPFVPDPRTPDKYPKRHAPGVLKNGDSVWYRGERYWLAFAPADWSLTSMVYIQSVPWRPNTHTPKDCVGMYVNADLVDLAPIKGSVYSDQPSKHAVETEQRKKELGVTDIGDDVATMLRGKDLDQVYKIAAKYLGTPEDELRAKYSRLNHGQQRMNLGNRMRNKMKKGR